MDADSTVPVRLADELWAHWEQEPSGVQALLCERGQHSGWVQALAPPLKHRWLQPTDLELLIADPPEGFESPTWRAGVERLVARGWQGDGSAPLVRSRPVPDGRTPELARWVVDELLVALELGHGLTELDGLHWVVG